MTQGPALTPLRSYRHDPNQTHIEHYSIVFNLFVNKLRNLLLAMTGFFRLCFDFCTEYNISVIYDQGRVTVDWQVL